ncbi:MAG: cadmium-translocating P-type ATPase [Flavobacteriales bacterium]|nr:cadmium-translocating P-type ATPase [Flavobacteriales bacterium]
MDNQNTIKLKVEGMTCANCASTVTKRLKQVGADGVTVDFLNKEATITHPGSHSAEELASSIDQLGYHATVEKQEETGTDEHEAHHHNHKNRQALLFCTVFTVPLFLHMFLPKDHFLQNAYLQLALCLPVFITGIRVFGKSAFSSIKMGSPNMDVLITIGSSAAFFYSLAGTMMYYGTPMMHQYLYFETAATIITLILLGNYIEERSVNQTTTALSELKKIQHSKATRVLPDGTTETVKFSEIRKDDVLQINMGDKVPADGMIIQGEGSLDESMITGESVPVEKMKGDEVTGGTLLTNGNLQMKAEKVGNDTLLSHIIELVRTAQISKPHIQRLGDKVSAIFVPAVLLASLITFLISWGLAGISTEQAIMNSIAVLVISCPCAMGLATPTAVMAGIGRAAKNGVLIKGGQTLETLATIEQVVFDKTGTLTTGHFKIKELHVVNGYDKSEIKRLVYSLESRSNHPIAKSLTRELSGEQAISFEEVKETRGGGMSGTLPDGTVYKLGSPDFVHVEDFDRSSNITVLLAKNEKLMATIQIEDEIKDHVSRSIGDLQAMGIHTIMLSGDHREKAESVAARCGIQEVYAEQQPEEKLNTITRLSKEKPTAMVGDGVNDAPALARASVGISIGNATQAAIQAAQVVLLSEKDLQQLVTACRVSRHTLKTIKQNLFWAFFYNVLAIPVAAVGLLNPMIAALTMAFSDVIVIGNSIRLKTKNIQH